MNAHLPTCSAANDVSAVLVHEVLNRAKHDGIIFMRVAEPNFQRRAGFEYEVAATSRNHAPSARLLHLHDLNSLEPPEKHTLDQNR